MAHKTASLVRYCKTEKGWRRYPVVFGKNGKLRPNIVRVNGEEREYPEGQYQVRFYQGVSKPIFENAGNDPARALAALEQKINLLKARGAAKAAGVLLKEEAETATLRKLADQFLAQKKLGSDDVESLYRLTVEEFLSVANKTLSQEIETIDILRYCRDVEKRLSDRTRSNRYVALRSFLTFAKLDVNALLTKEQRRQLKKYTKTEVETYTDEELQKLFTVCTPYYRLVFKFLAKTGFRMKEAMYLTWNDVDFKDRTVRVSRKDFGEGLAFTPKDHEERSVPLVNGLLDELQEWKKTHEKCRFVFGTRSDLPNNHWLEYLKHFAKESGFNCGQCKTCVTKEECEHAYLHKFRSTYATRLLQNGVDVRTVQKLLGHSSLEPTLKYLQPAKTQTIQDKVNAAFA